MEEKIIKRERGANYTLEEKHLLADLIMQYKEIIEDKRTGGLYLKKKKEAWLEVTDKYNSHCTSGRRSTDQLKALYDNMKQKARKRRVSMESNIQINKAISGLNNSYTINTDAKILAILDQLDPLDNEYDSGAMYGKDTRMMLSNAISPESASKWQKHPFRFLRICCLNGPTSLSSILLAPLLEKDGSTFRFFRDGNIVCDNENIGNPSQVYCEPLNIYEPVISLGTTSNTGVQETVKVEMEREQSPEAEHDEHSADNSPAMSIISKEDATETKSDRPNPSIQRKTIKKKNFTNMIPQKVLNNMTAEDLKKAYFKMKCENACLERQKIELELFNLKREHILKTAILKKQLDTLKFEK